MIYGIGAWQRSFKSGLSAVICKYDIPRQIRKRAEILKIPGMVKEIQCCYTNMDLYDMPFDVVVMDSKSLLKRMFQAYDRGEKGLIFNFDEAHKILNPRLWDKREKEETVSLAGIFQDDKLCTHLVYNFHNGFKDDELLGVDKYIRASTGKKIEIITRERHIIHGDYIRFWYEDRTNGKRRRKIRLNHVSRFYPLFNTLQPIK